MAVRKQIKVPPAIEVTTCAEPQDNVVPFKKPSPTPSSLVPNIIVTVKQAQKRIDKLKEFVNEIMVAGIDYGIIPEVNKPALLKPGAEKLCDAFGFSKRVEVINRLEDWDKGVFHYEVKVTLICKKTGLLEAEGIGSCNSKESAYSELMGHDVVNTVMKMAKKRALVDAVLTATRSSDIFTQDIDEMELLVKNDSKPKPASMRQLSLIIAIVNEKGIPIDIVKALMLQKFGVSESKRLTLHQASDFIDYLKATKNYSKMSS